MKKLLLILSAGLLAACTTPVQDAASSVQQPVSSAQGTTSSAQNTAVQNSTSASGQTMQHEHSTRPSGGASAQTRSSGKQSSGVQPSSGQPGEESPMIGMSNPASDFCIQQGGKLEIRQEAAGEVGYCHLPDGRVVEEWAFFRAESGKAGKQRK